MSTAKALRSQWWSAEQIARYQERRLVEALRHAVEHVPFYAGLGISAASIRSREDLRRFPVVTKGDVQDGSDRFLARGYSKQSLYCSRSSGMTGEPTTTYFDAASWSLTKYALKARRVLNGVKSARQRILIVSEVDSSWSPPWPLSACVRVQNLSLTGDMGRNLETLLRFAPTVIYGFPSYLLALVDGAAVAQLRLPVVPVIYTSSELLSAAARGALERAFGGRVIDIYGSTEFKEVAVQCGNGRYHINFESVFVESAASEDDGVARLLITSLVNKAMPLIRYELGDTGNVSDRECECGRSSAQIVDVHGRLTEMLSFPDGTRLSPYLLTTSIEQDPAIKHYRIVHEQPWALRIEMLARPPLSAAVRAQLETTLRQIVPAQTSLRFVELQDRGRIGKRRAVAREF